MASALRCLGVCRWQAAPDAGKEQAGSQQAKTRQGRGKTKDDRQEERERTDKRKGRGQTKGTRHRPGWSITKVGSEHVPSTNVPTSLSSKRAAVAGGGQTIPCFLHSSESNVKVSLELHPPPLRVTHVRHACFQAGAGCIETRGGALRREARCLAHGTLAVAGATAKTLQEQQQRPWSRSHIQQHIQRASRWCTRHTEGASRHQG